MYGPYNQCQLKTVSYLVRQVWQHVTNNTFPRPLGVILIITITNLNFSQVSSD